MKIVNMTSSRGNKVPKQFILFAPDASYFQSYEVIVAKTTFEDGERVVYLDDRYWDYSVTTSKYRNQFLGMNTGEIRAKVKSGEFRLIDLNA